jgi:hypothetical protein
MAVILPVYATVSKGFQALTSSQKVRIGLLASFFGIILILAGEGVARLFSEKAFGWPVELWIAVGYATLFPPFGGPTLAGLTNSILLDPQG